MNYVSLIIFSAGVFLGYWQLQGSEEGKSFDELYEMAAKAYANDENERALDLLVQAEKVRPYQIHSHNLRGVIYLRKKEFRKAQESFQKALQIDPQSKMIRLNLAQTLFDQKMYTESKQILEQLSVENRDDLQTQFRLFLCNVLLDQKKNVEVFLATLKKDKGAPLYDYCHAVKEFHDGNEDKAMQFVHSAFLDYSPEQNAQFSGALVELGFLKGEFLGPQPFKIGN